METLVLILSTFAVTSALTGSDGPFGLFHKLRNVKQAGVLECFLCTAVLIGGVFALYNANSFWHWLTLAFALGGGAYFLHALAQLDI